MALIIEDGTGKADAQSYISWVDVVAFWASRNVDLSPITEAEGEAACIDASESADVLWGGDLRGVRATAAQVFAFPRKDASYDSGESITGVPPMWIRAVAMLTRTALDGSVIPEKSPLDGGRAVKKITEKADIFSTTVEYADKGSYIDDDPYPKVTGVVRPLLNSTYSDGGSATSGATFGLAGDSTFDGFVPGMFSYPE